MEIIFSNLLACQFKLINFWTWTKCDLLSPSQDAAAHTLSLCCLFHLIRFVYILPVFFLSSSYFIKSAQVAFSAFFHVFWYKMSNYQQSLQRNQNIFFIKDSPLVYETYLMLNCQQVVLYLFSCLFIYFNFLRLETYWATKRRLIQLCDPFP